MRFLCAIKCNPTEIHQEICTVYGEQAMTRQVIGKWCKQFEEGRTELQDEADKGMPSTSTTADHIASVDELIRNNRRIKINEIVAELGLSYYSVHLIIHEHLNFNKVSALDAKIVDRRTQKSVASFVS